MTSKSVCLIYFDLYTRIYANGTQEPSTPSPGTSLLRHVELHTDRSSPVIIAANMIGCAMYELVGIQSSL
jgi:hypothetical protein